MLIRLICFFRGLYRSAYCGAWVLGHNYRTIEEKTPPNVHVLKCETCGKIDIGWSWGSVEAQK